MSAPGCKCGATWTGLRPEHCPACHQTFTGTTAGDKHRVGDHNVSRGPDRRRCLSVDEMTDAGMVRNDKGHWKASDAVSPWAVQP